MSGRDTPSLESIAQRWIRKKEGPGARPAGASPGRTRAASAELLGKTDDDALGATHEAEPVDVLVLRDLAHEFGTVGA